MEFSTRHLPREQGRLLKQVRYADLLTTASGNFVSPTVLSVGGIEDLDEEIFGQVQHLAIYEAQDLDNIIDAINDAGFGLTFALHSRIDDRVQHVIDRVKLGNIYINRNQIGAVVGSQPFGGEGLSGTGPKAGGPRYLRRFLRSPAARHQAEAGRRVSSREVEQAFAAAKVAITTPIKTTDMPGPTGESNRYSLFARGRVLCLGPCAADATLQVSRARALGCNAIAVAPGVRDGLDGVIPAAEIAQLSKVDAVVCWSLHVGEVRRALANRDGPIIPVLTGEDFAQWLSIERHVSINTTAGGGNAELMNV